MNRWGMHAGRPRIHLAPVAGTGPRGTVAVSPGATPSNRRGFRKANSVPLRARPDRFHAALACSFQVIPAEPVDWASRPNAGAIRGVRNGSRSSARHGTGRTGQRRTAPRSARHCTPRPVPMPWGTPIRLCAPPKSATALRRHASKEVSPQAAPGRSNVLARAAKIIRDAFERSCTIRSTRAGRNQSPARWHTAVQGPPLLRVPAEKPQSKP